MGGECLQCSSPCCHSSFLSSHVHTEVQTLRLLCDGMRMEADIGKELAFVPSGVPDQVQGRGIQGARVSLSPEPPTI